MATTQLALRMIFQIDIKLDETPCCSAVLILTLLDKKLFIMYVFCGNKSNCSHNCCCFEKDSWLFEIPRSSVQMGNVHHSLKVPCLMELVSQLSIDQKQSPCNNKVNSTGYKINLNQQEADQLALNKHSRDVEPRTTVPSSFQNVPLVFMTASDCQSQLFITVTNQAHDNKIIHVHQPIWKKVHQIQWKVSHNIIIKWHYVWLVT